jgi:hypothetical protein
VIQTRIDRVLVCPSELRQVAPVKPRPAAGAIVSVNPAGADFLAGMGAAFDALAALFADAAAACP